MPYTESGKKATIKYKKEHTRRVEISFNRKYEQEMIDFLERQPNVNVYLKELIKKDMMSR